MVLVGSDEKIKGLDSPNDIKLFEDYSTTCAIGSINSHYFHIIGDKLINPSP